MKIKIISDGTRKGTRVVNAETGELVRGVRGIKFEISSDREGEHYDWAHATLELFDVQVELECKVADDGGSSDAT